ncbi:hypothetical protein [Falsirhodobacter halotolerans]|uniref:hypothetical protein n=1 Tax=Falsirhodobacter halotolerans TaxID=1146892 RepID=UPI001FD1A1B4|nr:hypothetical protein [Falsirhodobacter halotolerans]MCJ8138468.1 hypothetical protein [Falsirhodobacter halotolerans]
MLEFLTEELREGLRSARRTRQRGSRLHIQLGDTVFPLRRMWGTGLSVDAARLEHLRGLVDIYDGPRHVGHCLIVASTVEGDELICEFKSFQPVYEVPPVDYERADSAVRGYLTAR